LTARYSLGALLGAFVLACLGTGTAAADGSVSGTVTLPDAARRLPPPERSRGFVARAPNPLKPPRSFDPLPHLIVVLEGGPVAEGASQPPREPVRYSIIGESFAVPLLPIVTGASVELRNDGKASPRLHAPAQPELMPGDPINPKGARVVKKLDLKYQALELRDHDSAHLSGWLVGFPHPYVARVDDAGKFQIKGVPPGEWTVRLWYRDGWLAGAGDKVTVINNKDAQVKLALPAELKVEGK
jgi:hypothetical protein